MRCWGNNSLGELGNGFSLNELYPTPVKIAPGDLLSGARSLSVGPSHGCVTLDDGQARCSGGNFSGQLGTGPGPSTSNYPMTAVTAPGEPLTEVSALAGNDSISGALLRDGAVYAWGYNGHGQLGNGTSLYRHRPVAVAWP